jgi:hypothetical protein
MHERLRPVPYRIITPPQEEPNRGGKTRVSKIVLKTPTCLVLQRIKSFLTFYNFGNVVPHDVDSVIYLCLNVSSLGIRPRASTGSTWSRGVG